MKHADEKSGVAFYHNAATKASQYAPPPSCAWSKGYVEGKPVYTNSVTRQRVWMTPKALAWKVLRSKTEDRCASPLPPPPLSSATSQSQQHMRWTPCAAQRHSTLW